MLLVTWIVRGHFFLHEALQAFFPEKDPRQYLTGLSFHYHSLLKFMDSEFVEMHEVLAKPTAPNILYKIGRWTIEKLDQLLAFFSFIGEFFLVVIKVVMNFRRFKIITALNIIATTGSEALSIVGLMAFLIGIVLVYQLGVQLQEYGATVYVVNVAGIAILREFAPLITAVIIAGRTSTSFAALIGSMKVNEEIDALKTMGLAPIETLVLPRVVGLIIALPLLVVWADFFGILGAMVMAKGSLGIGYSSFLLRLGSDVGVSHYVLGLIKTPVFALIIACVGCFQGLNVQFSAESVGKQTTKAAVQSIFLIILTDALFSILFSYLGL